MALQTQLSNGNLQILHDKEYPVTINGTHSYSTTAIIGKTLWAKMGLRICLRGLLNKDPATSDTEMMLQEYGDLWECFCNEDMLFV